MNDAETCTNQKYPEKNFDTLEVGRSYLNRCGGVVKIVSVDTNRKLSYAGDHGWFYYPNGHFPGQESPHDLIELIPKPSTTIPETGMTDIDRCAVRNTESAAERKATPVFSGVLMYFPDAIADVARCSKAGNDQHHPDKPLHWDRAKSTDELDALTRHLIDAGKTDTDGIRHSAKVAWRALANLQKEIERDSK